jgi:hypothetical protein
MAHQRRQQAERPGSDFQGQGSQVNFWLILARSSLIARGDRKAARCFAAHLPAVYDVPQPQDKVRLCSD